MNTNTSYGVYYYSKSGNTKKLAVKIADTVGCAAKTVNEKVTDRIDVLFLGASVYWAGIDPKVKNFIKSLDTSKVGKVVIFSTSALAERGKPEIQKLLVQRGIDVVKDDFYCRGEFTLLHRGKPDEKDLSDVVVFARKVMEAKIRPI